MRPIKCSQHNEIFEVNEQGQKQWIENWETYLYLGYKKVEDEVDIISLEDLRAYPVGKTKIVKTVTEIREGNKPRELFYPDEPEVIIRKISILGTCLPGCEAMMKDLGFTHAYGNRYGWPDYDLVESLGMKVFVNIRGENGIPTDEEIEYYVNLWKDRPGCGGYWSDTLGHEPDICNHPMEDRIRFYNTVRKYDPDIINHPVMEMYDLTEYEDFPDGQYPGWKNAYNEEVADLILFDCYVFNQSDEKMRDDIIMFHNKFTEKYCKNIQVIPQLNAFNYRPGSIRVAYETWKELLGDKIGIAYYKDENIRKNEEMQSEIKEVNEEIIK